MATYQAFLLASRQQTGFTVLRFRLQGLGCKGRVLGFSRVCFY